MNTERSNILNRLAGGEISPAEAARLLREPAPSAAAPEETANRTTSPTRRQLHVRVTDLSTGRPKVNVNLPLSWVELGLSIGARYSPEVAGFDLGALFEQIRTGVSGRLVEVEDLDDGERVEIFVD